MDVQFSWVAGFPLPVREDAEKQIRKDLKGSGNLRPCHQGPILVSVHYADPLGSWIEGDITCSCGELYAVFKGFSVNSKIDYYTFGDSIEN
ncbi:MAG: hypothetical protein SCH71_12380 [Desulfobulbaceae bacterium]|nr:hypothetical protein [Desulfobulbaceae bacterium]